MKIASLLTVLLLTTSIYTLQFQNVDGGTVSISQYEGKKILIVNIATGSQRVSQLAGLQQLHEQYGDSVVVIGFPTNSFGDESRTDEEIKQFCQNNYGVSFLLAKKNPVTGAQIQPVFNWLGSSSENGMMNAPALTNFQKFLVNESGLLIGVFAPSVEPTDPQIINALTNQ